MVIPNTVIISAGGAGEGVCDDALPGRVHARGPGHANQPHRGQGAGEALLHVPARLVPGINLTGLWEDQARTEYYSAIFV